MPSSPQRCTAWSNCLRLMMLSSNSSIVFGDGRAAPISDDGMMALGTFLKNGTNQLTAICGDFICFQNQDNPNYQLLPDTQPTGTAGHVCICVRVRALFSNGYLPLDRKSVV